MSILNQILAYKKEEVKTLKPIKLEPQLKRSLVHQMNSRYLNIIAEIKKGSPSKGLFAPDLNIKEQVNYYNQDASCISVLTDQKFFYGSFDILKQVRAETHLPILCKDFIIEKIQIDYAYAAGADLVLLIKRILSVDKFTELLTYAHSLGMEVLVEVHNIEEFQSIEHLDFKLCGINQRDLKDFSIHFEKTKELAPYIHKKIPYVIAESGIHHKSHALELRQYVDGYLIGESLVKNRNIHDFKLLKEPLVTKICGIKKPKDAEFLDGKVDMIGLVLCKSKRRLDFHEAESLRRHIKTSKVVGVFKDQSPEYIEDIYLKLDLDYVQVHNNIPLNISKDSIIYACSYDVLIPDHPLIIIDGLQPGSGHPFDTNELEEVHHTNYILAGGLNHHNVTERISACNCIGVDVSSGVEINGEKSIELMQAFINTVGGL